MKVTISEILEFVTPYYEHKDIMHNVVYGIGKKEEG